MVVLKSINYITVDDVMELTGVHWGDFQFSQMAENGSYVPVFCDDGSLEDLWEEYREEQELEDEITLENYDGYEEAYNWYKSHCAAVRLKNEIKLIEALRKLGARDEVLVYVSW